MSPLAEDLSDEQAGKPSPTAAWVAKWYATLDPIDQVAFDDYIDNHDNEAATLFRVCKKRGYPFSENPFREWVNARRDAS